MVEKGKRENINGHGECDFNYCRRRVRIAVSFAIPVSPELFAQFVARMLDCGPQFSFRAFQTRVHMLCKTIHTM